MCDEFLEFIQVGMIVFGFVVFEMIKGFEQFVMDVDMFVEKVVEQICVGEFYVVMYVYNIVWIKLIYDEVEDVYVCNVLCYEGDDEYDVLMLIVWLIVGRDGL